MAFLFMGRAVSAVGAFGLVCACAAVTGSRAERSTTAGDVKSATASGSVESAIELNVSPVVDMHFWLKSMIRKDAGEVPEPFRQTVQMLRAYDRKSRVDGPGWAAIETNLGGCKTVKRMRENLAGLPETSRFAGPPGAGPVPLREPTVTVADAYREIEPIYLRDHWPDRKARLDERLRDIRADFMPKMPACVAYMLEHLGIDDPEVTIPVYLVVDMPWPGARTLRRHRGDGICFVSINRDELAGSLLYETILHEATHALDIAAGGDDVFDAIRTKLDQAGLSRDHDAARNVPHTVMFVQAAETIRRIVDPKHEHYGVVSKYYDRVSKPGLAVGDEVRDLWTRYLDGKMRRAEAVDRLVLWTMSTAEPR